MKREEKPSQKSGNITETKIKFSLMKVVLPSIKTEEAASLQEKRFEAA